MIDCKYYDINIYGNKSFDKFNTTCLDIQEADYMTQPIVYNDTRQSIYSYKRPLREFFVDDNNCFNIFLLIIGLILLIFTTKKYLK